MKTWIIIIAFLILPGCSVLQKGNDLVFDSTPKTVKVETVEMIPFAITNSLGQISTNFVAQKVVKEVPYQEATINPQVESIAKNVGGYFGPIGDGITGLALVALGIYGNIRNSINKRKAIRNEKASTVLVESVEIAKEVIEDLEPAKVQEYIDLIKRKQELSGSRDDIRKLIK